MIQTYRNLIAKAFALVVLALTASCTTGKSVSQASWKLTYDDGISIRCGQTVVAGNMQAEYSWNGQIIKSSQYHHLRFREEPVSGGFGQGKQWTITYTDAQLPTLVQRFCIYDDVLLTDISIEANTVIGTNYMAPIVVEHTDTIASAPSRRALFVPFDNDAWVRFSSRELATTDTLRSYEATAIYDAVSRQGLVIGAIDHNQWKNAIDLTARGQRLVAYSGVADELTRDRLPHGKVSGKQVRSARMMIGLFSDWRTGMERYAQLCATATPPRPWEKAMPVGWNSWGALAFKVNHDNATAISDFFARELQPHSFANSDGLLYTGLDSGWNNFTEDELRDFADRCRRNNQVPCIYWTPFTDWRKNPEQALSEELRVKSEEFATAEVGGDARSAVANSSLFTLHSSLKYQDLYLYANGQPQELDGAYALDPTHPAVQAMMEQTHDLFRRCGFKYVKMDFMTHGRMEADSWYRSDITTGTEAYNYGMHLLDSIFSDIYLNLSISPIFPAQYAQSRRIACDAWNKIKDTEYTMNALSYGWWIDGIYQYNDADHVVLRDATEGENRARITSSVITGLYITGDDFSADTLAISRAKKFLTNPDINRLATGRSFRPLTGDSEQSEYVFLREEPDGTLHVVVFNYGDTPITFSFNHQQLGLSNVSYQAEELWSHRLVSTATPIDVPAKDVLVFRLSLPTAQQ